MQQVALHSWYIYTRIYGVTFFGPYTISHLPKYLLSHYTSNVILENTFFFINPLNAELHPIWHLLALLAHHIFHVSGLRVNINQLDALSFIISLFQACTCFEHM